MLALVEDKLKSKVENLFEGSASKDAAQIQMWIDLVGLLDGVAFVVESERTQQDVVRRELECLEDQTRLLGVVLNKSRLYIPAWLDGLL